MLEDFFENYFKIEKAYRKYFQDEMEKYHLTPNELLVLLFLARDNGGCNTARDIAQYEGVSKGLVARSVESLVEKQFLVVERDAADKRICHLYLTQQCSALTEQMTEKKAAFFRRLAEGIPEEAIATTEQTLRRFMENISASIDKSEVLCYREERVLEGERSREHAQCR